MRPAVTVLVDTYNHERFIGDAIRSVLDQDFPRSQMEILVVDDGSTDRTPEIVSKFEPRVRLLRKPNGGQASAFNLGIREARGEVVALLDGDDVWLPHKLSSVVNEFRKGDGTVMVYHKCRFWDPSSDWTWEPEVPAISGDVASDLQKIRSYASVPTSSLTFRREALNSIGPVPEKLTFLADAYLVRTAIFVGPAQFIPECLAHNRVHGGNLWFAERGEPNKEVLRRRVEVRKHAIRGVTRWIRANAPKTARPQVQVLMWRWRIIQDDDEFRIGPPSRFRESANLYRRARLEKPNIARANFFYRLMKAFAVLTVGKHAHYLEAIRTRVRKLTGALNPADGSGETAGRLQ